VKPPLKALEEDLVRMKTSMMQLVDLITKIKEKKK